MAKRFIKPTISWPKLEKRVPPDQKAKFFAFKAKSDAYFRRVTSYPEEPPKIDWEQYKKAVPVEGLVDKFKSEYEAYKVPYPTDTLTAKIDEQWQSLQNEIKTFCAERQKDIDLATKELKRVQALPKYDDMTMEMFYDMFPNEALDPVNRPTLWPHTPEEQPGYGDHPELLSGKKAGGH